MATLRILGIGNEHDLGDLYARLARDGHAVRVHVACPSSHDIAQEADVTRVERWEDELEWVGRDGLIVFETAGAGATQDALRRAGYRVVGGSALGDRLERERDFGQAMLASVGVATVAMRRFDDFAAARAFVEFTRRRYVLKFNGAGCAAARTYVGVREDGGDVVAMLAHVAARWSGPVDLVLMDHLVGVEVGVGAFFDGQRFLAPANLDWEHKRLLSGDLGELTGEMGTVVSYRGAGPLFEATLARLAPALRDAGHHGYVNLNMIVNERGAFALELTCRFGIPGYAVLAALQLDRWADLLARVADGGGPDLATRAGYAVGVVLTVPPFPYPDGYERLGKGLPILVAGGLAALSEDERDGLHWAEVRQDGADLVTAGAIGYVGVVTGHGATLAEARIAAYALVGKIVIPDMRYRDDIGTRLALRDDAELRRLGWLPRPRRPAAVRWASR